MRDILDLPLVFTVDELRRRGVTQEQAERRVEHGLWRRLQRGIYCTSASWKGSDAEGRHLLAAMAAARAAQGSPVVLSHTSAAMAYGLPVPRAALKVVTVTTPPGSSRAADPHRRVYRATLTDADITYRHGVAMTTPARTVADCLRLCAITDAVAVADAAVRRGLTTDAEIRAVLRRQERWPFAGVAALRLPLVDGRRESPLESRSAVVMAVHGLPAPVPQCEVLCADGRFVARVDFTWVDLGVVGEADGRIKYEDDAARVIESEKDRQAQLEDLGLIVVRWGERHVHGPEPLFVVRLRAAFGRGDGRRFRGRFRRA